MGHTPKYYNRLFHLYGYQLRSNKENSRKFHANFSYFKNIDSQEKAYWLGFISGDGYVSNSQNRKKVGLSLSKKDKAHLIKFKSAIDASYPISDYISSGFKQADYSRIIIESEEMFDDLVKLNCVPNKTNIYNPPNLSEKYISSFILGVFDADGCICVNNTKNPFYSISFMGTDELLNFIQDYLVRRGCIKSKNKFYKRKSYQAVSQLRYGGNIIVPKILDVLYEEIDHRIPLERKYKLYLKCKNKIFS